MLTWSETKRVDTEVGMRRIPVLLATVLGFALLLFSLAMAQGYTAIDLGTLGGSFSDTVAVTASGQVVGIAATAGDAAAHAFSWTRSGGMVDLGTLDLGGSSIYSSS